MLGIPKIRRIAALRALCFAAAVFAVALMVSACGASSVTSSSDASKPIYGAHLTIARVIDTTTLDPLNMTDNESIWVIENMYEPLYETGASGQLVPTLATGYNLSADRLTWTFHMRPGVKFWNGQPVTAQDAKFSIDRARAAGNAWSFLDAAIASVSAPNPATLVVKTKYPWKPLIADLAHFANSIFPANFGGESPQQFFAHPIATGPFMLKSWQRGESLTVVRNPHYWRAGLPYLASVTWTDVPNDNTRNLQLTSGETDAAEFPPFTTLSQLRATSGISVYTSGLPKTEFLLMNNTRAPFNNVYVRLAVAHVIDRAAMVNAVLSGYGKPANSFLAPILAGYDAGSSQPSVSVAAARADLAKSPVPHGFQTELLIGAGYEPEVLLGQIVQHELSQIGINVKIVQVDPNVEFTTIQKSNYDMGFAYTNPDIIDTDEMVEFTVGGTPGGSYSLYTGYNNPVVNRLMTQAARTFDETRRRVFYSEIQRIVASDAPLIPLYYSAFQWAWRTNVHGFSVLPLGNYSLTRTWVSH